MKYINEFFKEADNVWKNIDCIKKIKDICNYNSYLMKLSSSSNIMSYGPLVFLLSLTAYNIYSQGIHGKGTVFLSLATLAYAYYKFGKKQPSCVCDGSISPCPECCTNSCKPTPPSCVCDGTVTPCPECCTNGCGSTPPPHQQCGNNGICYKDPSSGYIQCFNKCCGLKKTHPSSNQLECTWPQFANKTSTEYTCELQKETASSCNLGSGNACIIDYGSGCESTPVNDYATACDVNTTQLDLQCSNVYGCGVSPMTDPSTAYNLYETYTESNVCDVTKGAPCCDNSLIAPSQTITASRSFSIPISFRQDGDMPFIASVNSKYAKGTDSHKNFCAQNNQNFYAWSAGYSQSNIQTEKYADSDDIVNYPPVSNTDSCYNSCQYSSKMDQTFKDCSDLISACNFSDFEALYAHSIAQTSNAYSYGDSNNPTVITNLGFLSWSADNTSEILSIEGCQSSPILDILNTSQIAPIGRTAGQQTMPIYGANGDPTNCCTVQGNKFNYLTSEIQTFNPSPGQMGCCPYYWQWTPLLNTAEQVANPKLALFRIDYVASYRIRAIIGYFKDPMDKTSTVITKCSREDSWMPTTYNDPGSNNCDNDDQCVKVVSIKAEDFFSSDDMNNYQWYINDIIWLQSDSNCYSKNAPKGVKRPLKVRWVGIPCTILPNCTNTTNSCCACSLCVPVATASCCDIKASCGSSGITCSTFPWADTKQSKGCAV